jgi:hypothetical protein
MTSLLSILRSLQRLKFTVLDLLSCVIDGYGEFEGFRNALFLPKNQGALIRLLDKLYQDDKGRPILSDWMLPHSIALVQEKIHKEMEAAKPLLQMHMGKVTPAFIENWDIHRIMEPVTRDVTPTLTRIIESAGESKALRGKTKATKSKNRATVCYGQSTVMSNVDDGGVVLNVDGGSRQELDYNGAMDEHTRGERKLSARRWMWRQGLYCHGRVVLFGFLS